MANEITKFSNQELEIIKKQFFPPKAKEVEIQYCLSVAQQLGLNPITKEIFFVPRKYQDENGQWIEKIEPLVGRDGFLSIAHKSGKFGGMKSWTTIKQIPQLINGKWTMTEDLVAICEVYRTDTEHSFVVEVNYNEYVQKKKDGNPTKFWAEKPHTMLKKVAESQCLRKAFNIHGVYSPEEIGIGMANGELHIDKEAIEAQEAEIVENEEKIEQEIQTLQSIGLNGEYKDGWIKAVGDAYSKKEILKQLGYRYFNKKKIWAKQIA